MSDRVRPGRRWPYWAGIGVMTLLVGMLLLHLVHLVAGHWALVSYGPAATAGVVFGSILMLPGGATRSGRVTLGAVLLLLVLGTEWLESELAAGHRLAAALMSHARPSSSALGTQRRPPPQRACGAFLAHMLCA